MSNASLRMNAAFTFYLGVLERVLTNEEQRGGVVQHGAIHLDDLLKGHKS
jgi:hypothetical protein